MHYLLKKNKQVLNVDAEADKNRLLSAGWTLLTPEQITTSGMLGYEHLVSPANTIVNVDGSITFTPPAPPSSEELFTSLRTERDMLISAVLWMRERHADELELGKETTLTPEQYAALLTYIQALRDLPAQLGAPWDGGGDETPWPVKPEE